MNRSVKLGRGFPIVFSVDDAGSLDLRVDGKWR